MKTYSREQAIDVLENGGRGAEVYTWARDYQANKMFAFVVIYRGKRSEGWWVALHRKVAIDPDQTGFDCIDALQPYGPTVPHGCSERHEFPSAEQAIDFAMLHYSVSMFADHETVTRKYKDLYSRNAEQAAGATGGPVAQP